MAEAKCPKSIDTEENDDLTKVKVTLFIPGFKVEKKLFSSPKPGKGCEMKINLETTSLEVSAKITTNGNVTDYNYKVNQLPGEIDPVQSKSDTEYKKDMIILNLAKKDETSWAVLLKKGLDQAP